MPKTSRETCEEKLENYNVQKGEYDAFRDDVINYKASFDFTVKRLEEDEIPAKEAKVEERQGKLDEISGLLGGASTEEAQAASGRIEEIDARLAEINARLNEIMALLDGEAEPMEVPLLFDEGERLAAERDTLLTERSALETLIDTYNSVVGQIESLDGEVKALDQEIEEMQRNIDALEQEAMADKNYYEEAQGHAAHRRYNMEEIEATWEEYECSGYGMSLPGFDEEAIPDLDDVPEDDESELDTGDYEIPEEIDDPGEPDEGEDWNPDDYESLNDTG